MLPSFDTLSLIALMAVTSVRASDFRLVTRAPSADAVVTPTAPGPNDVFKIGGQCTMSWTPDTSGSSKWKDMSIDFMTGSNLQMVKLANVASNLDGTDPATTSYTWTCPEVDPPSQIYFYQWTHGQEEDPQWTTRFLITAADGTSVDPPQTTTFEGKKVGYGTGKIVGGSTSGSSSDSSDSASPSSGSGSGSGSASNETSSEDSESTALPSTTTAPSAATSATGLTNTVAANTSAASANAPSAAGQTTIPALAIGCAAAVVAAVAQIL